MSATLRQIDPQMLQSSRDYCHELTRRAAKNFYYGLKLMPEPKRSAMYALYAYMRLVDDIADEPDGRTTQQRIGDLNVWKEKTHAAFDGDVPNGEPLWPAFAELVGSFQIPRKIFDDMIDGQAQDLDPVPISTFEDLHLYCYRVASVVGLASIYVWGFQGGEATEAMAIDRGIAFQLTNVLRDLSEDAALGRCYLPADELRRFGVTQDDLRAKKNREAFLELMRFQIARAREYYLRSTPLESHIEADSQPTLIAMTDIYYRLLEKIALNPEQVLHKRVRLGSFTKLCIAWRAMRSGGGKP
jgi:15-cis-phytoene synthase